MSVNSTVASRFTSLPDDMLRHVFSFCGPEPLSLSKRTRELMPFVLFQRLRGQLIFGAVVNEGQPIYYDAKKTVEENLKRLIASVQSFFQKISPLLFQGQQSELRRAAIEYDFSSMEKIALKIEPKNQIQFFTQWIQAAGLLRAVELSLYQPENLARALQIPIWIQANKNFLSLFLNHSYFHASLLDQLPSHAPFVMPYLSRPGHSSLLFLACRYKRMEVIEEYLSSKSRFLDICTILNCLAGALQDREILEKVFSVLSDEQRALVSVRRCLELLLERAAVQSLFDSARIIFAQLRGEPLFPSRMLRTLNDAIEYSMSLHLQPQPWDDPAEAEKRRRAKEACLLFISELIASADLPPESNWFIKKYFRRAFLTNSVELLSICGNYIRRKNGTADQNVIRSEEWHNREAIERILFFLWLANQVPEAELSSLYERAEQMELNSLQENERLGDEIATWIDDNRDALVDVTQGPMPCTPEVGFSTALFLKLPHLTPDAIQNYYRFAILCGNEETVDAIVGRYPLCERYLDEGLWLADSRNRSPSYQRLYGLLLSKKRQRIG